MSSSSQTVSGVVFRPVFGSNVKIGKFTGVSQQQNLGGDGGETSVNEVTCDMGDGQGEITVVRQSANQGGGIKQVISGLTIDVPQTKKNNNSSTQSSLSSSGDYKSGPGATTATAEAAADKAKISLRFLGYKQNFGFVKVLETDFLDVTRATIEKEHKDRFETPDMFKFLDNEDDPVSSKQEATMQLKECLQVLDGKKTLVMRLK